MLKRSFAQGAIGYRSVSREDSSLSVPSTYVSAIVNVVWCLLLTATINNNLVYLCVTRRSWRGPWPGPPHDPKLHTHPFKIMNIFPHYYHCVNHIVFILIRAVRPLGSCAMCWLRSVSIQLARSMIVSICICICCYLITIHHIINVIIMYLQRINPLLLLNNDDNVIKSILT